MKELMLSKDGLNVCTDSIVRAIQRFVADAGVSGAVIGLSGGIDSALVAALGKKALGEKLQALIMPEVGVTQEEDTSHATMFADEWDIPYRILELNEALDAIRKIYPEIQDMSNGSLARANIAPRMRMLFNYVASNLEDRVVLGTGNKTELLLGYFTKYGDGGVDFLPIGSLYKTQVRQLARHVGVAEYIREKAPSAGLWEGQTDEKELGESYETLDRVLYLLHDKRHSLKDVASELELDKNTVERIHERVKKNNHKITAPPMIVIELNTYL